MSKKKATPAKDQSSQKRKRPFPPQHPMERSRVTFAPINDVPDKAPAPQVDWTNPDLSFDDVLPSNYFSMEELELWLEERGAESRI